MTRYATFYLPLLALAALSPASVAPQNLGPLVELSQPNPVPGCDTGFNPFGYTWSTDHAEEPSIAANPFNPGEVVAAWFQGLWQDMIAGVSFDYGQTWQRAQLPLTFCTGGAFPGVADIWLSFAPDGNLYAVAITWNSNSFSDRQIMVSKSADGGLHWSTPVVIPGSLTLDPPADHPSITADPVNAKLVYATWTGDNSGHSGAAEFSRSTDGGLSWEPARTIVQTASQGKIQFSQIFVLPNGTLLDIFEFYAEQPNKPITFTNLQVLRSTDHGQTWSAPANAVTMTPLYRPFGATLVVDPETGQFVLDLINPSFAMDRQTGNLYAAWEDGRFSSFQYNDIALSMSADGGSTWSAPIKVNQTPLTVPPMDRQAFFPAVAVAANGTIGVSYYDFRFNDPNPGLPTDRWLARCKPSSKNPANNPGCWGREVRLTDSSFNMEAVVPRAPNGDFFIGDYFGLAAGNDFVAPFTAVDNNNITSIFARQVEP